MNIAKKVSVFAAALCLPALVAAGDGDGRSVEKRIDALLRRMTLEEKVGQMNQLSGFVNPTGVLDRKEATEKFVREGTAGSVLNIAGAAAARELQRVAVEESRLGIPLVFAFDVIHGFRTIFPVPLAESCSWDLEAMERSARIAAVEASAMGIQWTFAPMVDIARDPRWGRIVEGAGEDPYLGSLVAAARVRGFQGDDLKADNTIAACAKHFAAYGAAEGGRDYNLVDISDLRLRQVYLPPFKAAADAGVATFMNAFNDLNGVPATANKSLVNGILRGEWGFEGVVVSDWHSVVELIAHDVAEDKREAALVAASSCDIDMEGDCYRSSLAGLVREGKVSEKTVDEAVRRVLRLKFALGLFDDPYRYFDPQREKERIFTPEHLAAARDMARRSIVLLENRDGVLPLSGREKRIAVIGPAADAPYEMLGPWSAHGDGAKAVSVLQGMRRAMPQTEVLYERGCDYADDDRSGFAAAVEAARRSDVVLLCVGEPRNMSGEAGSRTRLTLPGVQRELIEAVAAAGKPVVLLLSNGRPLVLEWEREHIPTIVETWYLGTETGNAVADVLLGKYNPSGKLTASFPYNEGQIPVYYSRKSTGRPYQPGNPYVTHYVDAPVDALYPFGYGLSYTTFEYGDLRLDKAEMEADGRLTATVTVKNTGAYDGEEVVQLYIRDCKARITPPVKELKAFRKIALRSGEQTEVSFELTLEDLKYTLADGSRVWDPGRFEVYAGGNSRDVKQASFELK